jgi:hypothetical protein
MRLDETREVREIDNVRGGKYKSKSDNTVQIVKTYVLCVLHMSMLGPSWA